jgi:inhibitor of KinA
MERGAARLDRHARLHDRRRGTAGSLTKLFERLRIEPLGDAAAFAEAAEALDLDANRALQALAVALRARNVPWIRDVVPALTGIALHFDPDHPELPGDPLGRCAELFAECERAAGRFRDSGRLVEVPVCYDARFALDMEEVAAKTRLSPAEIVRLHSRAEHRVLMVGFSPGQPYIGGLDAKLAVPRRATPRTRVPAGSVAIANAQTAVYSFETPGGWNVIGRTPLVLFDPRREPPSLFAPGDRVRFAPIGPAEFERLK